MKTAIPNILDDLGDSEFTVLEATYCKARELRSELTAMHEAYLGNGTPPTFASVKAAGLLADDLLAEVEIYVQAIAEPGTETCLITAKAA